MNADATPEVPRTRGCDRMEEYTEVGSGEPIESENLVEFHLLYGGPLHSAGHENPRVEKHSIRKVFHSQLRRLWETNSYLREYAVGVGQQMRSTGASAGDLTVESFEHGARVLGANWNRNGFNFLPLVQKRVCLRCSLDILFLRVDEYPFVFGGSGDIDARMKQLFDSLRMADAGELPVGAKPEQDENPFFVLLEDDKLISEVRVNTDRLLKLPEARPPNKHDVYLQISVRLNPTVKVSNSWVFE
jgi:hypothetical protein